MRCNYPSNRRETSPDRLTQAQEREDKQDNDNEADDVDDGIHGYLPLDMQSAKLTDHLLNGLSLIEFPGRSLNHCGYSIFL